MGRMPAIAATATISVGDAGRWAVLLAAALSGDQLLLGLRR